MKDTTSFCNYLNKQKHRESTIKEHIANIKRLNAWAESQNMEGIEQLRYADIMAYVAEQKNKNLAVPTINIRLNSLRKYYEHLKEEGTREDNPTKKLYIKGSIKKAFLAHNYKDLETLYSSYIKYKENQPIREEKHKFPKQRNIVMLGLFIWQGLQGGEIEKLETSHIDLSSGAIYIPSTYRGESRELKLDPKQILPMYQYIESLKKLQPEGNSKLFICARSHDSIRHLSKEIQGLYPEIKNLEQIRASVIMYWIKAFGKRTAQYMAGHRHISSTERYEQQDIETLIDQLAKHHPFG